MSARRTRWRLALPLAAIGWAAQAADAPSAPLLFSTQSRIEVDAQGSVTAVSTPTALPEAVNAALEANLRKLRFAPAMRDGHAVPGVTFARQEACTVPQDGGFRLAVHFLGNGPGALQAAGPPPFPFEAQRASASATVKVVYRVEPDGAVAVESAELLKGRGRYSRDFLEAARSWMASQRAEPEQLDGRPVATRVSTEVAFLSGPTFTGPSARQMAQRSAQSRMDQSQADRIAGSRACAIAGQAAGPAVQTVALTSPFHAVEVE